MPQLTKKKIMLLNFPLLDVGGIVTWSHQIQKGFAKLGFQADHYYCTPTGRFKSSTTEIMPIGGKFKRGEKIPSQTLGYHGQINVDHYWHIQKEYDYVIFIHPSPHPTKANKKDERIISWKNLYENCSIPKVVIFHDKKWHKTNKWFLEVHNHIDVILAAQHNFIESVNEYANKIRRGLPIITDWLYFPIEIPNVDKEYMKYYTKENRLCMMPQWIKWKNHEKLLNVAKDIKIPIHFYNGGMEYHKIAKKDIWQEAIKTDWVEDEYINKDALHEYHGFVTYEIVKSVYTKSFGAIDLTTRTYQNYTHHESCLYGTPLLCTEECRQGPYNHIHDGEYWPIDMNDIAGSINNFWITNHNTKLEIAYNAAIRTRENFACEKIAKKINDIVETI